MDLALSLGYHKLLILKAYEYDTKVVTDILGVFPFYPLYRTVCKIESIIQTVPSSFHHRIRMKLYKKRKKYKCLFPVTNCNLKLPVIYIRFLL